LPAPGYFWHDHHVQYVGVARQPTTSIRPQRVGSIKMKRVSGIATIFAALTLTGVAQAAPGDNGNGVGGCIDFIYGNATNPRPSGHGVLPSQSPGPFVNTGFNEPPRNDRTRGGSIGDFNQAVRAAPPELGLGNNIPQACRTLP
jgi:hypothetical protein